MRLFIFLGAIFIFGVATLALAAATLGTLNTKYNDLKNIAYSQITTRPPLNSPLAASIPIQDVMLHLREFQRIASLHNETRAIHTTGFDQTVQYIADALRNNTNFSITRTPFNVRQFRLGSMPTFTVINSTGTFVYNYSANISVAQFYQVRYSGSSNISTIGRVTVVRNFGCSDADWVNLIPPPSTSIALLRRGDCTFREKAEIAARYSVSGILFYNDGLSPDRIAPIEVTLGQENNIPALFLSSTLGYALATAASNQSTDTRVELSVNVENRDYREVQNICADTPTGDPAQTIIIGSHTDSVPAGPGINDNGMFFRRVLNVSNSSLSLFSLVGSGSAANLALAIALARLFQRSNYPKYTYRVRFCWWAAEELGLLGSDHYVTEANRTNTVGNHIVNLNYDMLASPNYIFGIYDGRTAKNGTSPRAVLGSNKITALFRDWFIQQNLPWDYTDFSGRSDYGPFLAAGVVAGGLFTGADETKSEEQRLRYDRMLGQSSGGVAGIIQDPCYHKLCDSIQNIDVVAYERMVQAAAYMLENLAQRNDLRGWLGYVRTPMKYEAMPVRKYAYNSINEYFNLPYL